MHLPRRYAMFCESENGGKCMYLFLCFVLRKQPFYVNPTQGVINEAPECTTVAFSRDLFCLFSNS